MASRYEYSILKLILILIALSPFLAWGRGSSTLPQRTFLLYGAGNLALASSGADKVDGALFNRNMRTPLVGALGLGAYPLSWLWVGVRYEYWFAGREFLLGDTSTKDTLHLQMLGPELGYVRGNPRVAYIFAVGGMYPLEQKVSSSSGVVFNRGTQFWNYHARASMELKLNSRLDFHLEAGYRWLNLKDLTNQGNSFLQGGADLNLSGPFVGFGLGFMF